MQHQKVSEKLHLYFIPCALGNELVYRCKINASCWCTWHLEHQIKDKKEQSCVLVRLMTCCVPVNKSASKYYKIFRVPVRNAPLNILVVMCARNNNRPAGVKSASNISAPVILIIQWFVISVCVHL